MPASLTDVKQTVTESSLLLNIVWYLLLSLVTVLVMWYLSAKNLPWHIRISVFIALGASLSIVIMVPFDVQSVYHLRCQNSTYTLLIDGKEPTCPSETVPVSKESQTAISAFLSTSWKVIFFITNLQGWFLLQLQQAYNDAGQFTRWGRFRQAMKENVAVLVLLACLFAVMVGYNKFIEKEDNVSALLGSLGTLVAFLSQASVCALLGHGLIEVPRYYWSRRSTEAWLDSTYSDLVRLQMNQESARKALLEKMRLLSHYNINCRHCVSSAFDRMIDMTMQVVPPDVMELPDDAEIREMEYNSNDHNEDALVALHASIKGAVTSFNRASAIYHRACVAGCFLEDVVLTSTYRKNNDRIITSSLRKQARSRLLLLWQKFEYYRYVVFWKYTSILMTLLMVLMSLTLMVSELLLLPQLNEYVPKDDRNAGYGGSILYWIADVSKLAGSAYLVMVIVFFLSYMCFCLYFTLLRVKVFSLYEVVPGHTDGTSLLIQCYLVTRLVPAICYNFLDMLREASTDTAKKSFKLEFESVYGGQSSFAGISFDRYLPTAIVLVSVLVAFNFFSKMSAYFRGSNPHQADFMQQGKTLLKLERQALERQMVMGAGRQTDSATHFWIRIRSIFKRKGHDPVRTSSASVEMSDVAEGDRSPLSPVRRLDSSSYVPEEDV